jgi:chitin synthase
VSLRDNNFTRRRAKNAYWCLALILMLMSDLVNLIFNWLSVSSFYLAFYFLIDSSISGGQDPFGGAGKDVFQVFNKVYIGIM